MKVISPDQGTPPPRPTAVSVLLFLAGGLLTLIAVLKVTLPLVEVVLVCLVLGPHAYFTDHVRITVTKPARFTTGEIVPGALSAVVTLGGCVLTLVLLGMLYEILVKCARRLLGNRPGR